MGLDRPRTVVVSCIIERGRNEVLICRQSQEGAEAGEWEFLTGTVRGKESPEAAMRRTAKERLGITIDIHTGQPPLVNEYQGAPATYRFFVAYITEGQAEPNDYAEIRWVRKGQLCEYDFAGAQQQVVDWYVG